MGNYTSESTTHKVPVKILLNIATPYQLTTFVKTKAQAAKADMATTQPADKQTSQASKVVRLLATQDLKPLEESSAVREKG